MKKLQNDFTTPEQSRKLLEIGVPVDSANCYYLDLGLGEYSDKPYWGFNADEFPCWSAGRLIEIYELCSGKIYERKPARLVKEGNVAVMKEITIIEDIIGDITNARLYIYPHMDFSKLED